MTRAVERERTDNGRFAAANSLALLLHSPLRCGRFHTRRASTAVWKHPATSSLGTSRRDAVWHVIFPASLPGILHILRVTMGWAWTYLVVAELIAANSGLGFISLKAMRGFQVDTIFLAILLIGLLGMISDFSFRLARRWLAPWAD